MSEIVLTGFTSLTKTGDRVQLIVNADGSINSTLSSLSGPIKVHGYAAAGSPVSGHNPVTVAFQDFPGGNTVIPTGLDISGVKVLGTWSVDGDLHLQDFSANGETYVLGFATANSKATAQYARVDSTGNQTVYSRADSSAITSVAASVTSVTLLASNTARKGATIFNDSTAKFYIKLGATASTSSFTILMLGSGYYELPFGYTGIIDGIWASATGNARIAEIT
jgi:hypothetical protein